MELRPGYRQTDVGVIPEDWNSTTLREAAELHAGINKPLLEMGQGALYVTVQDLYDGTSIRTERLGRIRVSPIEVLARSLAVGDIVFGKSSVKRDGIGYPSQFRGCDEPVVFTGFAYRARARKDVADPTFLFHTLRSSKIRRWLIDNSQASALTNINRSIADAIPVVLPPIAEQRAIAEALSEADALIESLGQLLAKKRQLKQGAMQELLTGKKRLHGFEVKPGYKQTELGVVPEDWEVATLAAVCSMKSGEGITSPSIDQFSEYPCYGGNGLRGFTTRFTHEGRYALIGRVGALCGNVFGVEGKFFASEHAIVVTASARTDSRWLTFVLGEMRLNQYSESSAQPVLAVSKLLRLAVARPPTDAEQAAIATILSDMNAEIAALEAKMAKVRQMKLAMMQELLSGGIRLPCVCPTP